MVGHSNNINVQSFHYWILCDYQLVGGSQGLALTMLGAPTTYSLLHRVFALNTCKYNSILRDPGPLHGSAKFNVYAQKGKKLPLGALEDSRLDYQSNKFSVWPTRQH